MSSCPQRRRWWIRSESALWLALLLLAHAAQAAPNDPFANSSGAWGQQFADQWALTDQRLYVDIAPRRAGEKVVVAVIDTGLDYTHEDLSQQQIWRNPRERANGRDDDNNGYKDDLIGWNFVAADNNPWDDSGHGTHIAGVIAACTHNGVGIAAVNSDAVIMPLKVANFVGQARSSNVAAAIYYAVDNGAQIINLSLGSEFITELEREAAVYAQERNVLIVVSAGNRGLPTDKHGYAGLPGAMVVGASAPNGERAGFSNFGDGLAVLAPGVDVLSLRAQNTDFIALSDPLDYEPGAAVVGDDGRYYRATGTSFAAAVASGVASKLKSLRPQLSADEIRTLITQNTVDMGTPGQDQLSGFGGLNFLAALGGDPRRINDVRFTSATLALQDAQLWVDVTGRLESSDFVSGVLEMRPRAGSIPAPEVEADSKRKRSRDKERKRKKRKSSEPEVDPYAWQPIKQWQAPQNEGSLVRLSVEELTQRASGSTDWELRLTVNGDRHATMALSMPQPEVFEEEVAAND